VATFGKVKPVEKAWNYQHVKRRYWQANINDKLQQTASTNKMIIGKEHTGLKTITDMAAKISTHTQRLNVQVSIESKTSKSLEEEVE